MKTKIQLIAGIICLALSGAFAQLKVNNTGDVGIGTITPTEKFHLANGNLRVDGSSYLNGNLFIRNSTYELRLIARNGDDNPEIGGTGTEIDFYHPTWGWQSIMIGALLFNTSDSTLKKNIKPLNKGIEVIKKINCYQYQFIKDESNRNCYGVLAQELERTLPDLVKEAKGSKLVNYLGLIPILIEGMKEQQKTIEDTKAKTEKQDSIINALSDKINACCSNHPLQQNSTTTGTASIDVKLTDSQSIVLFQNDPNPYSEMTVINYILPDNVQKAQMLFYNSNGKLIQSVELIQRGQCALNVFASDLSNGLYTYTLVVDGKIFETKKMVKQ